MRPVLAVSIVTSIALHAGAAAGGDERAAALHREAIVVDGHNDVTTWILDYGFDLGMDGGSARTSTARLSCPWAWRT
jgi:hypothetical protein